MLLCLPAIVTAWGLDSHPGRHDDDQRNEQLKFLATALFSAWVCAAIAGIIMNAPAILDVEDTGAAQLTMPSSPFLMLGVVSVISGGTLVTHVKQQRRRRWRQQ